MREVLEIKYDAATASLLVRSAAWMYAEDTKVFDAEDPTKPVIDPKTGKQQVVPAIDANGDRIRVRVLADVEPIARFVVDDLPPPHRAAFKALLEALPDLVEASVDGDTADPEALRAKAAQVAQQRHQLEVDRLRNEAEIALRREQLKLVERERAETLAMVEKNLSEQRKEVLAAEAKLAHLQAATQSALEVHRSAVANVRTVEAATAEADAIITSAKRKAEEHEGVARRARVELARLKAEADRVKDPKE